MYICQTQTLANAIVKMIGSKIEEHKCSKTKESTMVKRVAKKATKKVVRKVAKKATKRTTKKVAKKAVKKAARRK